MRAEVSTFAQYYFHKKTSKMYLLDNFYVDIQKGQPIGFVIFT